MIRTLERHPAWAKRLPCGMSTAHGSQGSAGDGGRGADREAARVGRRSLVGCSEKLGPRNNPGGGLLVGHGPATRVIIIVHQRPVAGWMGVQPPRSAPGRRRAIVAVIQWPRSRWPGLLLLLPSLPRRRNGGRADPGLVCSVGMEAQGKRPGERPHTRSMGAARPGVLTVHDRRCEDRPGLQVMGRRDLRRFKISRRRRPHGQRSQVRRTRPDAQERCDEQRGQNHERRGQASPERQW
jgi:hypothetical protein